MRCLLTFLLIGLWIGLDAQTTTYPYNPDANGDSAIGAVDLLELLPIFGSYFNPDEIEVNNVSLSDYLNFLEAQIDSIASNENTNSSGIDSIFVENDELVIIMSGGESQHFPLPTPNQNITYTTNNYSALSTPSWMLNLAGEDRFGPSLEQAATKGLITSPTDLSNFITLYPDVLFEKWLWGIQFAQNENGPSNLTWNNEEIFWNPSTPLSSVPHIIYGDETGFEISFLFHDDASLNVMGHLEATYWPGPNSGTTPNVVITQVQLQSLDDDIFSLSHFHPANFNWLRTFENCVLRYTNWHMPLVTPYLDIEVQIENSDLSHSNFYWPNNGNTSATPDFTDCDLSYTNWFDPKMEDIQAYNCDFSNATFHNCRELWNFDIVDQNTWTNAQFLCVSEYDLDFFPTEWISWPMSNCSGPGIHHKVVANY